MRIKTSARNEKIKRGVQRILRSNNSKLTQLARSGNGGGLGLYENPPARRCAVLFQINPGMPHSCARAGPGMPWFALVDDILHAAAAGPNSFHQRFLEWWVKHADCLIVDAGTKILLDFYDLATSWVKVHGAAVLVVQTAETRRLVWHKYFQSLRMPSADAVVFDIMDDPTLGAPFQLHRMGEMGDDFGPNGPSSEGSLATVIKVI